MIEGNRKQLKNGQIKQILYKTRVIPILSKILDFREYQKSQYCQRIEHNPNRWYFKFLPIKKNKIVFDNFIGSGYGDNPKAIAEEIMRQGLSWDLVWLTNKEEELPTRIRRVKYGSLEAMRELATAKVWVFNCRNVKHPKKRWMQKYLQTWHGGYPLKLIEKETEQELDKEYVDEAKNDGDILNAIISSSEYLTEKYKKNFWLNKNAQILEIGVPKNDVLFKKNYRKKTEQKIREMYSIKADTKIVLYLPTFRDKGIIEYYDLEYERIVQAFEKRYGGKFVILFRLHPNALKQKNAKNILLSKNVVNVSDYPEASDLYCIADALISDYSGVLLAFGLQRKPIFIYASDLKHYMQGRGLNELYKMIPCKKCQTNDELINEIINHDADNALSEMDKIFKYIHPFDDGHASEKSVEWIENQVNHWRKK